MEGQGELKGQGKEGPLTTFAGEIDGTAFLGYSNSKWYFCSNEKLFIYDKSRKLVSENKLELPKEWKKASIQTFRMVKGKVIALASQVNNTEDERSFINFDVAEDGKMTAIGVGGKPLFVVEETNKLITFKGWYIDANGHNRSDNAARHVGDKISVDSTWILINHVQSKNEKDSKDKIWLINYFVLDAEFNLVHSFRYEPSSSETRGDFGVTHDGTVYMVHRICKIIGKKECDFSGIRVLRCKLGEKSFSEQKTETGDFQNQQVRYFNQLGQDDRIVCLGQSKRDAELNIDQLIVYRFSEKNNEFRKEYDEDLWKIPGKGKPAGAYGGKKETHLFRIKDLKVSDDDKLYLVIDDHDYYTSTQTNSTTHVSYTTTYDFITYIYAIQLSKEVKKMDWVLNHRYIDWRAMEDYQVFFDPTVGEITLVMNDNPKRYGPNAKPLEKPSRRNIYRAGGQDLIATYTFTAEKGFKNKALLPIKQTKGRKLIVNLVKIQTGEGQYLFYIQKGKKSKKHEPVILQL